MRKMNQLDRMKELVELLNEASKAYYAQDREIMSNYEYDRLYDELVELERSSQTVLASSPTQKVGYEAVEELPKEAHETAMLSLDKTKDRLELAEWLGERTGLLSWKLDGLTIVLTYEDGKLAKAVTRGNGETGEVVTNNAKVFSNLPLKIPFLGRLVLRGEAVITYEDFEKINALIPEEANKYKNPRNLCSGSVRQLNNEVTAARNVRFYAFSLVVAEGEEQRFANSREEEMLFLERQGFEIVEYEKVTGESLPEALNRFEEKIVSQAAPSDGLVLIFDDIAYGKSLGRTAKFPRDAIAFKWADEKRETKLIRVEWSPSRTGLINPVAVFEPVELEGTTVSRASLHNISIVKGLKLGIGDCITVYKANMIIPQVADNLTGSDDLKIPETCPACSGKTQIKEANGIQSLYCPNPECSAKKIKAFTHFVSRDALNMEGLSESTLEKWIARGFLHNFTDLFHLEEHRSEIEKMEGFGEKSCTNLLQGIEKSRNTTLPRLIYGLGIANIGLSNAKMICRSFHYDLEAMKEADVEKLASIEGIGEVIAAAFRDYFRDDKNREQVDLLLKELKIQKEAAKEGKQTLEGLTFVITGSLNRFENRNALKEKIEERGGKVAGSVSAKTTALINNDSASGSGKNKKAKELGVRILTEDEFLEAYPLD